MPDGKRSICSHCEPEEVSLYLNAEFELESLKSEFSRLGLNVSDAKETCKNPLFAQIQVNLIILIGF